jgi:hypothetical protein
MAENALKYRLFRHSAQQSSQKSAAAVQEMPYFAADFAQPLVPQPGFPITRRSDSVKKPYKNPIKRPRPAFCGTRPFDSRQG